jgi:hypothetical protein
MFNATISNAMTGLVDTLVTSSYAILIAALASITVAATAKDHTIAIAVTFNDRAADMALISEAINLQIAVDAILTREYEEAERQRAFDEYANSVYLAHAGSSDKMGWA